MSDQSTPHRPPGPRLSHLHSEPVPISFASPQQLAAFTSGNSSFFGNPQMKSPMNAGFNATQQKQTVQATPTTTTTAHTATAGASSKSASAESTVLKPLPPQPVDLTTFKGFKFVTLDALQVETREIYDKISGTFRWEMCESQDDRCIEYIRTECTNRRVFLVSSGALGSKIVPEIHELPQVYAIYIYCANIEFHGKWAAKYPKVRVVCDNDDLYLLPQFAVDVAQANIDWGDALFKQGTRDKAKEKFQLAYDKLNNHARNHDPAMIAEIRKKIEECK